ncbi:MAG: type II toxin-antitoxin system death-on-curing family toxin [Planctomycetota bacterium]|jgi:death-on-curing protein
MKEPIWIRDDVVRAIHSRQLSEHGGQEGIRDEGLLDSALTRPRSKLNYSSSEPDLAELAASYAYGLSQNHPFIDGNKRTAYVACRTFLILNGRDIVAPQEEKVLIFLQLAAGTLSEQQLAEWIRNHLKTL